MATLWLTKLLLAHFLTDFVFQKSKWIEERRALRFRSPYLYVHTALTALVAWCFIGWEYWHIALIIFITHTIIDGWKSYQEDEPRYFLIDQALHLLVIFACWWFSFYNLEILKQGWSHFAGDKDLIIKITAFVFLSFPCSYLVGQLTKKWSYAMDKTGALNDAGKWIGIIERMIILVLVLESQYEAIGLIIAAKGIIRFNETNRTERKTEYLLIGTLISFTIAIVTGLIVRQSW
ncbi:MAG: DUF3307 domain-containing protein [Chitinophagaceae bacterium]|nr:DUF3307 domain-containing protein [Chitinophagaceae bacterium]